MFDGVEELEKLMLYPRLVFEGPTAVCDGVLRISGGGLVDGHSDKVVCGCWHVDSKVFSSVLEPRCISLSQFAAELATA